MLKIKEQRWYYIKSIIKSEYLKIKDLYVSSKHQITQEEIVKNKRGQVTDTQWQKERFSLYPAALS
jgi:hypothetical protein